MKRLGDRVAVEIRDRCLKIWAAVAVAMIHAYDPELLVIGGGIMKSADVILPAIEAHVHQYAWTPWERCRCELPAWAIMPHCSVQFRYCRKHKLRLDR